MLQDFVFGFKVLLKQKAFTAAALLTLALCIGANTAIFAVLEGVVLRGLPYPNGDRLVTMYNIYPGVGVVDHGANAVPDYLDRRKLTGVFSEVALIGGSDYELGVQGSPQRIEGQYVTPSFFTVLGIKPILGRVFTEEEAVKGKDKVVVLTEGLWREQFGRDPNVLGKDLRLSGALYKVVGVMPSSFVLPGDETRLWVPFVFNERQLGVQGRHSNNWGMLARLKPGISIAQARERIDALNRQNLDLFPEFRQLIINVRFATKVVFFKDELVRDVRPTLYLLQIAVGVVLLIGCVNLANLMLVRANGRMREMAIRFSLGAGRWRITRQLLSESLLLAFMGAALGVGVGYGGVKLLAYLGAKDLPRGAGISMDAGALAFTAAIAALVGIGFGLAPLIHVLRSDLNEIFRGNERGGTAGRGAVWVRSSLVVCQFAFAFVLLIGAGLLTISFSRLLHVSPGFRPDNVLTAQISMPRIRYDGDTPSRAFMTNLFSRLSAIPGVRYAGGTTYLPFSGDNNSSVIEIVGHPLGPGENPPTPGWNHVSAGYIPAMGISLISGRIFTEADNKDAPKAVIIDEFLAHRYWPKGDAVGKQLKRGLDIMGNKSDVCTIIGVVNSVKTGDMAENNPVGQIYFHVQQYTPRGFKLVVKTDRDNPRLIAAIRNELRQVDPELPLSDVKTMNERLSRSLSTRRAAMALCLMFAGLALLLAAIGIYGVLAYSVSQRTREFGIRVALGAGAREVIGMVVGQGLRMAAIGLGVGAIGAFALTRLMSSMLYDVRPSDPATFMLAALSLAAVACAASLAPSARAVRIPAATALRYE
jgi:predicted permease